MNEIKKYALEWQVNSNDGKVILELQDGSNKIMDKLSFENFIALTKVLEKGNAWIKNNTTIFNKLS